MGTPIPIMAGIYMSGDPVVRIRYPQNLVPVPGQDGVADGHLRPAEGISAFATGQGVDRAGIVWTGAGNDVHYRVSGTKLISVGATGLTAVLGDVGGSGFARMDFSFDRLGILSNGKLWYYTVGGGLVEVTDPNIPANLIDMKWLDSYWAVTDGTNIAVSDIAVPTTFNILKFGTTDRPNPVQSLLSARANELIVVSRNYIDFFKNVGGSGFPFQRVTTAAINKGSVGRAAACVFNDMVAFVGGGRGEGSSVYLGRNAQAVPVSTTEIDTLLSEYTSAQLATVVVECQVERGAQLLLVHLPDRTAVYDAVASVKAERPMWHIRCSGLDEFGQYRARNATKANDVWVVGDPQTTAIGVLTTTDSQHYGLPNRWEFSTLMLRAAGTGATLFSIELLGLTGVVTTGTDPRIATSYSEDGVNFSRERFIHSGQRGQRAKKLKWFRQGTWKGYRIQKFRGDSGSRLSVLSIDADLKALEH